MSRSFALLHNDIKKGRYLSNAPVNAVKKAFNEHLRTKKSLKKSKKVTKTINIVETTQGSSHKQYAYKVTRALLKKPKVVVLKNGTEIVYKYQTTAVRA
jgi:hypothetical protein